MDHHLYELELDLENESVGIGIKRYRAQTQDWYTQQPNAKAETERSPGMTMVKTWVDPLAKAIDTWTKECQRTARRAASKADFVAQFDPHVVAFITAKRCVNALAHRDPLAQVSYDICSVLIDEINYQRWVADNRAYFKRVMERIGHSNCTRYKRAVLANAMKATGYAVESLSPTDRQHLGRALVEMFMQVSGLFTFENLTQRNKDNSRRWHAQCRDDLGSPLVCTRSRSRWSEVSWVR